jgi:hypothetical protein
MLSRITRNHLKIFRFFPECMELIWEFARLESKTVKIGIRNIINFGV